MTSTTSNGDQGIAAEESSVQMKVTWVVVAVAVAVGAVVVGWLLRKRTPRDPLSRLIVQALDAEWADRTGAGVEAVRSAALRGEPAQVKSQLVALVEDVEISFQFNGAGPVRTLVQCRYADGTSATTTIELPWEEVPQEVRAQFLRGGEHTLSRHWSVS